jgi:hypothetical protein
VEFDPHLLWRISEMKWSEFEAQNPKELFKKLRQLCEDHHGEVMKKGGFSSRFCNHCYEREGWKCFPCSEIKKVYDEGSSEQYTGSKGGKKKNV